MRDRQDFVVTEADLAQGGHETGESCDVGQVPRHRRTVEVGAQCDVTNSDALRDVAGALPVLDFDQEDAMAVRQGRDVFS